jgi:hypothetical protein
VKIAGGLEKVIKGGLLFILAGTSLAFGSIYTLAYRMVQMLAFFLFFLWGVRQFLTPSRPQARSFLFRYPFLVPFLLWIGLVVFQLVPLRPEFLQLLSSETLRIYRIILGAVPPNLYPLSLSSFDTWRSLLQVITCAILFYLVANLPPYKDPSRARDSFLNAFLWTVTLVVGFQAFYGLAEYFVGHKRIYFFYRRGT